MDSHAAAARPTSTHHPRAGTVHQDRRSCSSCSRRSRSAPTRSPTASMPGSARSLQPVLVPVLLVLSAIKFALVAMFYMHLKHPSGEVIATATAFSKSVTPSASMTPPTLAAPCSSRARTARSM